jgi:hypothetical protein
LDLTGSDSPFSFTLRASLEAFPSADFSLNERKTLRLNPESHALPAPQSRRKSEAAATKPPGFG